MDMRKRRCQTEFAVGEARFGWRPAPQHTQSQLGAESCPRRPREHLTKISPSLSAGGSLASPQGKEFRVLGTL